MRLRGFACSTSQTQASMVLIPSGSTCTSSKSATDFDIRLSFQSEPVGPIKQKDQNRDRLRPQLLELTIFALTLLGPSGGVATNRSWASAIRAERKDSALCACPRERRDNSSTSASGRGAPGSHDDGGPDASAPHC